MSTKTGRTFVRLYYRYGPALADYIRDKEVLKRVGRGMLRPLVWVIDSLVM